MLPDQINNLFNVQFFVTAIMWVSLLAASLRRQNQKSRRILAIIFWLAATLTVCPLSGERINGLYATLVNDGIQRALDEQCGKGYVQAETGTYTAMSSYHWRWNTQRSGHFVTCDYERGYIAWKCSC